MAQRVENTALTTQNVDKRVRMKEIREQVAAYLKNNPEGLAHLGELPGTMEDAVRVIIAVQDLHEIEREKHRKATMHICELVHMLDQMNEYQTVQFEMISQQSSHVRGLEQVVDRQEQELISLRKRLNHVTHQRDAVLTTMTLQANMRAPEPMVMEVGMGSKTPTLDHIVAHLNRKGY